MDSIGKQIRMARKNTGLSQQELADKIGKSVHTVSRWETDKHIPTVDELNELSSLLNVTFDFGLESSEKSKSNQDIESIVNLELTKLENSKLRKEKKRLIIFIIVLTVLYFLSFAFYELLSEFDRKNGKDLGGGTIYVYETFSSN